MTAPVIVEVDIEIEFDPESMPTAYLDAPYLEDTIKDVIHDSITDLGATEIKITSISTEGLE